jgi:ankyrin repeat protein
MPMSPGPPSKKIRLDIDSSESTLQQPRILYDRPLAQGNAQVHNGNTQNTFHGPVHYAPSGVAGPVEMGPQTVTNLMEALAFDQMDTRLQTISTAHSKTCQWLFAREEYKTWRDPRALRVHNGFFWIKGKPGAGKSTLMKSALRYGEKAHEGVRISFFFNARGEELQRSLEGMYRSLLYQLLEQMPHLSAALPNGREHASKQGWHIEVLKELFEAAILALGSTQVTCYVDALDECDDSEARAMVEAFEAFGRCAVEAQIGFRVLLSSRRYPHITIEDCQELDLEGQEGHEADIADYVRCKLKIGQSKIANEIRAAIQARASGVFLWVVLVIRILNECDARGKKHLLKKRLDTIPDGLSELFDEILRRGKHASDDLLLTFQWILFAQRPLKREELYFAITTDCSNDDIEDWDRDEITADVMERFLLDASKGLAEMTRGKQPTVQFIHESVKEYLLSTGLTKLQPDLCGDLAVLSHDRLVQCCCHYMKRSAAALLPLDTDGVKAHMKKDPSSMKKLRDQVVATHAFMGYAVQGIMYHANLAHAGRERYNAFVTAFPYDLWRRYYNLSCVHHSRRLGNELNLVYALVLMGAPNLTDSEILRTPSRVSEHGDGEHHRSLLHVATDNGDSRMISLLLEHEADVNYTAGKEYGNVGTCLDLALRKGHPSMVQALLDAGAGPIIAPKYDTYLSEACYHDKMDMVAIFIDNGVSRDPHMTRYLLGEAVRFGREEVVQKLLDYGMHVDLFLNGRQDTALTAASEKGHRRIVDLLLNRKAQVNHCDLSTNTALHYAVRCGHSDIAQTLLNFGADPNLSGTNDFHWYHARCSGPFGNALHIACSHGEEEIVRILLRHFGPVKFDAKALDGDGDHAISLAAKCGRIGCVRALLETEIPLEHLHKAVEIVASGRVENRVEIITMLLAKTVNLGHVHQST